MSFSLDAYQTTISDRIGIVSRFTPFDLAEAFGPGGEVLLLLFEGIDFIQLFSNLTDTKTSGIDAVFASQFATSFANINFNSNFSLT